MTINAIGASNSSGFERREREYQHTVENSEKLAQHAAHHRPFYEPSEAWLATAHDQAQYSARPTHCV